MRAGPISDRERRIVEAHVGSSKIVLPSPSLTLGGRATSAGSPLAGPIRIPMEAVLQLSLLTVSLCLGAALVVRRTLAPRPPVRRTRIDVEPVSDTWLIEHRVRSRPE